MDIDNQLRLAALYANFRTPKNVKKGFKEFLNLKDQPRKLSSLLRSHEDKPIELDKEVMFRDNMDFLIAYYSILSASLLTGYLTSEIYSEIQKEGQLLLDNKAVKDYYKKNYPLNLPQILQICLKQYNRGIMINFANSTISDMLKECFEHFLQLYRARMEDDDLDTFLFLMDNGTFYESKSEQHKNNDDLWNLLSNKKKLAAFNKLRKRPRWLESGMTGFVKFVDYFTELASLLEPISEHELFCSAIWHLDGYWFKKIQINKGKIIKSALSNIRYLIDQGYYHKLEPQVSQENVDEWRSLSVTEIDKSFKALNFILSPKVPLAVNNLLNDLTKGSFK